MTTTSKKKGPREPRVCLACAGTAPAYMMKFNPDKPSILSLNVTIYRHIRSGRQHVSTGSVRICESCAKKAFNSPKYGLSAEASLLATAIIQRIQERYSKMIGDRAA